MPEVVYRLFFNNQPAKREQLDRVEEITVEQEMDMAWEARLQIPVCLDEKGNWMEEDEDYMQPFTRIRVEIKVGDAPFVPLIDGPIVGYDSKKSSEPGQSSIDLIVHDDSVYLNREEQLTRFENMSDHEIAEQLYSEAAEIASTDVETTPAQAGNLTPAVVQRGTAMQILRALAKRQGMHAYALPGENPGKSVGCFKRLPTTAAGLPNLILVGTERNVENFNVTRDSQKPAKVKAYALRITDKVVVNSSSSFSDLDLLGPEQPHEDEGNTATVIARPDQGVSVDLDRRVAAEMERASYSFEATGSVLADCYTGLLSPYRIVTVRGVNDRLSGDYLIHRVTHTLTRSEYMQAFTLKRNARSEGAGSGTSAQAGSIF